MKKIAKTLVVPFVAIAAVAAIVFAANGPVPSVGLYWLDNTDPTVGPGMAAPLYQFLIRTDVNALYYKSGTANTAWTVLANGGTGITGTLTPGDMTVATGAHSIGDYAGSTCGTGALASSLSASGTLACSTPIAGTTGDLALYSGPNAIGNYAGSSCSAGAFAASIAATGALTCATPVAGTIGNLSVFTGVNAVGNYAGSACPSGQLVSSISASGAVTCTTGGTTPVTASATSIFFGTGGDGDVVFDGVTTPVCGAILTGSTYALQRDCIAHNATINAGITVQEGNWALYGTGTLTFAGAGATVMNDGNPGGKNGSCTTGCSTAVTNQRYGGMIAGGTAGGGGNNSATIPWGYYTVNGSNPAGGGTGAAGASGAASSGQGGGGGGCSGAAGSGATGGSTAHAATPAPAGDIIQMITNNRGTQYAGTVAQWTWGAGGGAGSTCAAAAGTGGAGGGFLYVGFNTIAGGANCNIHARGGNGGNATVGGTTGGGGGGGGGGLAFVAYMTRSCSNVDANGGTGGSGNGATNKGGDGGSGAVVLLNLSGNGT